jgi:hypothetical protein
MYHELSRLVPDVKLKRVPFLSRISEGALNEGLGAGPFPVTKLKRVLILNIEEEDLN